MKTYTIIIISLLLTSTLFAEGLMIPGNKDYPDNFLKNLSSEITVNIYGNIAETRVLQEFKNEWYDTVNATYSFPLPINARTTRLMYSRGDTMVDAILKVQQQDVNPGTGEGGAASLVNAYMGKNAIRINISDIRPQSIQKIELQYITELTSGNGTYSYRYPFNTENFVDYPLEYLKLQVNLLSSSHILQYDLGELSNFNVITQSDSILRLELVKNKIYPKNDIRFNYAVSNNDIALQFFSTKPDSGDGYFTLIVQPRVEDYTPTSRNIVFVLEASTSLSGKVFDQSKLGIKKALTQLQPTDKFEIIAYNSSYYSFNNALAPATESNIAAANTFLDDINLSYANRLDMAVSHALEILKDETGTNSILLFSRGYNYIDLSDIAESNTNRTGIFSISIGKNVEKTWLQTMCNMNYGFSTFIPEDEDMTKKMADIIPVITSPVFSELQVNFENPTVYAIFPEGNPKLYNGSDYVITGRYAAADTSYIVAYDAVSNADSAKINVTYASDDFTELIEKLWAKMAIDKLEAIIMIDGENDTTKAQLIELSLKHNMRCRYTAYVATYETNDKPGVIIIDEDYRGAWEGGEFVLINDSEIYNKSNPTFIAYPNPASDILCIKVYTEIPYGTYLTIFDVNGRVLARIKLTALSSDNMVTLHLKSLLPGYRGLVYLRIEGDGFTSRMEKIVVR